MGKQYNQRPNDLETKVCKRGRGGAAPRGCRSPSHGERQSLRFAARSDRAACLPVCRNIRPVKGCRDIRAAHGLTHCGEVRFCPCSPANLILGSG